MAAVTGEVIILPVRRMGTKNEERGSSYCIIVGTKLATLCISVGDGYRSFGVRVWVDVDVDVDRRGYVNSCFYSSSYKIDYQQQCVRQVVTCIVRFLLTR